MIGWWKLWKEKVSEKLKVEIKLFRNIALRPMSRMEVVWVWRAITSREIWSDFISAPRKVWSTYCFRLKDLFGFFLRLCCCSYNVKEDWRFFQNKKKLISTSKVPHFFESRTLFYFSFSIKTGFSLASKLFELTLRNFRQLQCSFWKSLQAQKWLHLSVATNMHSYCIFPGHSIAHSD